MKSCGGSVPTTPGAMMTEFETHLKVRGYAPSTVVCYTQYLGYFRDYLEELRITDIKQVTRRTVREYQAQVMGMSLAGESKALRIRPVKR